MAKRLSSDCLEEFQAPKKKLESAGDLLIKELFQKQQNVKINLKQQLAHPTIFESPKELIPLSSNFHGTCTAENLQRLDEEMSRLEELKASGLSIEQIELYQNYKSNGIDFVNTIHRNHNKSLLSDKIEVIESIISDYKDAKNQVKNNNQKNVNTLNPELMVKPNSVETKLLKFTLTNKEQNVLLEHPMNKIKDLEKTYDDIIDANTSSVNVNKIRRKARKLGNKIIPLETASKPLPTKNISKWDVKETVEEKFKTKVYESTKVYTCKPQNLYTIKNGEIVKMNSVNESIQIAEEKLGLEEIKKINKFKNYAKGDINKVLYVKNLPHRVEEKDLRNLFIKFNLKNELTFKIMSGKMKGQAFITFTDESSANQALETLNGTILNGKPMIIEFGKRNNIAQT